MILNNTVIKNGSKGGVYNTGTMRAENCTFTNNTSSSSGGAINSTGASSKVILKSTSFINNNSGGDGGAVIESDGILITDGCSFVGNTSGADNGSGTLTGGAVRVDGNAKLYANNTVFANNRSVVGAAIYSYGGGTYLMNCTITGNIGNGTSYPARGAGIDIQRETKAVNCLVLNNYMTTSTYASKAQDLNRAFHDGCNNLVGRVYNQAESIYNSGTLDEYEESVTIKGTTYNYSVPKLHVTADNRYYVPISANGHACGDGVKTYFYYDDTATNIYMGYDNNGVNTQIVSLGSPSNEQKAIEVTTYMEGGTRTSGIIGASGVEAPTGVTLTYNGEAQALANSNGIVGVLWSGAIDGIYTESVPTATNAGTYTIYYKIDDGEPVEVTATIQPKELTVSGIAAEDKDYDGNTEATLIYDSVTFAGLEDCDSNTAEQPDNITVTATGTFDNENVGTDKTVTISNLTLGGTSASNYTLAEDGQQDTATATITPAALTEVSVIQSSDLIYNGNALVPAVTASATAVNDQEVTFTYSDTEDGTYTTAVPSVTDAGTYTRYYKATAPNHSEAAGSFTVTVIYPAAEVTTAPTKVNGLIYDGTAQTLINNDGVASGGTLMYAVGNDDETAPEDGYDVELPSGTNAGSYYIWYKAIGDATHSDSLPVCITTVIGQADITEAGITVAGYQGDYDGA
ncbi:MAG: hypothetical protein IJ079_04045, partial [Lachnospiraceae bacterium]|nr:hypothetical protein [Lachnospiraceae bacterium]